MGLLEWIASIGGIGAVFGVIMVYIYRHDRASSEKLLREDRKFMEDRMTRLMGSYNEQIQETNKSRDDNTKILSELITWLKAKNGS